MNDKPTIRNSSKYAYMVGTVLVITAVFVVIGGFYFHAITSGNVIDLEWCLLISASTFFGLNLTRIAAESITTIKAASNAATNPPVEPTTVTNNGTSVTITQDQSNPGT